MARKTYEEMGEVFDRLTEAYMEAASRAPKGVPVTFNGLPTTDVLVTLWEGHRAALTTAFAEGGWTEEEWEAELDRRIDARLSTPTA